MKRHSFIDEYKKALGLPYNCTIEEYDEAVIERLKGQQFELCPTE